MAEISGRVIIRSESAHSSGENSSEESRRRRMEIKLNRLAADYIGRSTSSSSSERETGTKKVRLGLDPQNRDQQQPEQHDVFQLDLNAAPVVAISPSEVVEDFSTLPKFGITSVRNRRRYMEDEFSVHRSFCGISGEINGHIHFFAVFDGHGCSHVATLCKERMHEIVKEELLNQEGISIEWENVMKRSFIRMDEEAVSVSAGLTIPTCKCELRSPDRDGTGSTAVVALVTQDKIIVANCGDSRAVLCLNDKVVCLSMDHKPNRPDELKRIKDAGGWVVRWDVPRVFGVLAMSRAIGDKALKPFVISEPEVKIIDRSENDVCLILASDGLWDALSKNMAFALAKMCLNGDTPDDIPLDDDHFRVAGMDCDEVCSDASALLTKAAMIRNSSDNISVVVVDLRT